MFKLYDGREEFFQWDLDEKLIVEDKTVTQVHFSNKTEDCSLVCEVYELDGLKVVNVPNILLQDSWDMKVYAYRDNHTVAKQRFKIVARTKPADYVYTETEIKNYEDLEKRIAIIEANGGGGEIVVDETYNPDSYNAQSGKAVREALQKNTDIEYNPESENAQSGKAVAEALSEVATKTYVDDLIGDIETALTDIEAIQDALIGGNA